MGALTFSSGDAYTCYISSANTPFCWGRNGYGEHGLSTTSTTQTATPMPGVSDAVEISAGHFHTCVIRSGGSLHCTGRDTYGQLGDGGSNYHQSSLVEIYSSGVSQVGVGDRHSCAVLTNGGARCWGEGASGKLGNGLYSDFNSPQEVTGYSTSGASEICGGGSHSCLLGTNGNVYCTGNNARRTLGTGDSTNSATMRSVVGAGSVNTAVRVVCGFQHNCLLSSSNAAFCWGDSESGALGLGSIGYHVDTPTTPTNMGSSVVGIYAGSITYATCFKKSDGYAYCTGSNTYGQMGTGNTAPVLTAVLFPAGNNVKQLALNSRTVCVEMNPGFGGIQCVGSDNSHGLGNGGAIEDSLTLTDVVFPTKYPTPLPISTMSPTMPTKSPTSKQPTFSPTRLPSISPTRLPSISPTRLPSFPPTRLPSISPTRLPSFSPTRLPSFSPTRLPSTKPPSFSPTKPPSFSPTKLPSSQAPTPSPSRMPIKQPSKSPTKSPTKVPTALPSSMSPITLSPGTTATFSPSSMVPTTFSPSSMIPTTLSPSSMIPTTLSPSSMVPTTLSPNALLPNSVFPTTLSPAAQVLDANSAMAVGIGASVGVLGFILLFACVAFVLFRRRKRAYPQQHFIFFSYAQRDTMAEVSFFYRSSKAMFPNDRFFRDAEESFVLDDLVHKVENSTNVIMFLSGNYLRRPFTVLEMHTTFRCNVHRCAVNVTREGMVPFDFAQIRKDIESGAFQDYLTKEDWKTLSHFGIGVEEFRADLLVLLSIKAFPFSMNLSIDTQDVMAKELLKKGLVYKQHWVRNKQNKPTNTQVVQRERGEE